MLLLYEGTLHQGYADARVQSYVAWVRSREAAAGQVRRTLSIDDADTELGIAERALRRALAIDPSLVEARIRLAHVLDARGKSAEASALARQALASPLPKFLEYYGAMVLGRSEAGSVTAPRRTTRSSAPRRVTQTPSPRTWRSATSCLPRAGPPTRSTRWWRTLGPDARPE